MKIKNGKKNARTAFFKLGIRSGGLSSFTKRQLALKRKHGTPAEFAAACYNSVPGFINMDEAKSAIQKYNAEWEKAARMQR